MTLCFRRVSTTLAIALAALLGPTLPVSAQTSAPVPAAATRVLFIGNSFTFGATSAVRYYRAGSVRDLNGEGIGGTPALFKSFADQSGLPYTVALETRGGTGIDWHLAHKRELIAQEAWDVVVAHGYSTLDAKKPGDATRLIASARSLADLLRSRHPTTQLWLEATFPRADQTYLPSGAWYGKTVADMARDVQAGYERAAQGQPAMGPIIPVGQAWVRAMQTGVADDNPYDGVAPDKLNLWGWDHYHGSTAGYYLKALVVFGALTGRDPVNLGEFECSGFELGLSGTQIKALQRVASDTLQASGSPLLSRPVPPRPDPQRCAPL